MRLETPLQIERAQWLQALGVKGRPERQLLEQMDLAEKKLFEAAMPQGIFRVVKDDSLHLKGQDIEKHLDRCNEIVVMAATLGVKIDTLIRSSQIRDMAQALLFDCGASVLIEQVCDRFQDIISREAGPYITGRYSPGYGDFPIETQKQLLEIIDAPRKIGLTVNRSFIMIPRKSVTAIIGVSKEPVTGHLAGCHQCALKETCDMRKRGQYCGDKA